MPLDLTGLAGRTGTNVFVLEREARSYRPPPRAPAVDDDFLGFSVKHVVFDH